MPGILAASGGFLLAVLWMDLMFDAQVLGHRHGDTPLPEEVLASIAAYYRRVATGAVVMRQLVALVMLVTIGGSIAQALGSNVTRWRRVLPILLAGSAIALAAFRILPNAARLGARTDPAGVQSALAFAILRDHVLCFVAIAAFLAVELSWPE